jgi:hypothetical protein
MTNSLTYHASRAHTDDLLRGAAAWRLLGETRARSDIALVPPLARSPHAVGRLRHVLSGGESPLACERSNS